MPADLVRVLLVSALMVSGGAVAQGNQDIWIGGLSKTAERAGTEGRYHQCNPSGWIEGDTIHFSDWDLTRAVVANLCFRVYQQGLTDDPNGSPGDLNVHVYYGSGAPVVSRNRTQVDEVTLYPARFVGREGNNFVYALAAHDFVPVSGRAPNGNTSSTISLVIEAVNVGSGEGYGVAGPFHWQLCPGRSPVPRTADCR